MTSQKTHKIRTIADIRIPFKNATLWQDHFTTIYRGKYLNRLVPILIVLLIPLMLFSIAFVIIPVVYDINTSPLKNLPEFLSIEWCLSAIIFTGSWIGYIYGLKRALWSLFGKTFIEVSPDAITFRKGWKSNWIKESYSFAITDLNIESKHSYYDNNSVPAIPMYTISINGISLFFDLTPEEKSRYLLFFEDIKAWNHHYPQVDESSDSAIILT